VENVRERNIIPGEQSIILQITLAAEVHLRD
jgi:hypothetical protein